MRYLLIMITAIVMVGCQVPGDPGTKSTVAEGEMATSSGIDGVYSGGDSYNPGLANGYNPATSGNYYDDSEYGHGVVGGPSSPAKDRVIYFSYDSSNIDPRAEEIVKYHANYLKDHPNSNIILEGHTDSRGSREYNIALGERRAVSVLRLLNNLGVSPSQIRIISYGEEMPAVDGFSEDAYKRNRRVVIQY